MERSALFYLYNFLRDWWVMSLPLAFLFSMESLIFYTFRIAISVYEKDILRYAV